MRVKQPRLWTVLDSDGIPAETIDLRGPWWTGEDLNLPPNCHQSSVPVFPPPTSAGSNRLAPMLYLHVVASLRETPELMSTILRCLAEPVLGAKPTRRR